LTVSARVLTASPLLSLRLVALGAASIAAAAGFVELAKGGAEVVEHLSHISEKTGISIHDLPNL